MAARSISLSDLALESSCTVISDHTRAFSRREGVSECRAGPRPCSSQQLCLDHANHGLETLTIGDLAKPARCERSVPPRKLNALRCNYAARCQSESTGNHIFKLAHITRPIMVDNAIQRILLNRYRLLRTAKKPLNKQRNILASLAQRRQAHLDDIQGVEQVFPKLSACDSFIHVLGCGHDQPKIGLNRLVAPQPLDRPFLSCPQELGL